MGQNGRILIASQNLEMENLVVKALHKIVREAHTGGLTDRIKEFIIEEKRQMKKESD